jgi:hypothetical protein
MSDYGHEPGVPSLPGTGAEAGMPGAMPMNRMPDLSVKVYTNPKLHVLKCPNPIRLILKFRIRFEVYHILNLES